MQSSLIPNFCLKMFQLMTLIYCIVFSYDNVKICQLMRLICCIVISYVMFIRDRKFVLQLFFWCRGYFLAPKHRVQSLGNKIKITFFSLIWLTRVKSILLSFQLISTMQISKVLLKDINKILFFAKFESVQNILVNYVTIIKTKISSHLGILKV